MEPTTILAGILALVGMGALVVMNISLGRVVARQGGELAKLALRKPYWIIEKDDRGEIKSGGIRLLETRLTELEHRSAPGTGTSEFWPPEEGDNGGPAISMNLEHEMQQVGNERLT